MPRWSVRTRLALLLMSCLVTLATLVCAYRSLFVPFVPAACLDMRATSSMGDPTQVLHAPTIRYAAVFSARGSREVGHALLTLQENVPGETYPRFRSFGFYAKADQLGKDVWKQVDGELLDESALYKQLASQAYDLTFETRLAFVVYLTKQQYDAVASLIDQWRKNSRYELFTSDCVSFLDAVLRGLGLRTPARLWAATPQIYLRSIMELNTQPDRRCS